MRGCDRGRFLVCGLLARLVVGCCFGGVWDWVFVWWLAGRLGVGIGWRAFCLGVGIGWWARFLIGAGDWLVMICVFGWVCFGGVLLGKAGGWRGRVLLGCFLICWGAGFLGGEVGLGAGYRAFDSFLS